jgi:hypothetical protein
MRSIYDYVPAPAAHWPMKDNAASTVVREEVGGLNGAASQNTEDMHVEGIIGGALDFNGVDDRVAVADAAALDVTDAVTLSARVKLDATWSSTGQLIAKMEDWDAGGQVSYSLSIDADKKVRLAVSDDGNTSTMEVATAALDTDVAYHVAGTYDGAGTYRIYVNGILVTSDAGGNASSKIHVGTGRLGIGARYDSSEVDYVEFFKGVIEDVRAIHRALVARQVRKLYDNRGQESIYGPRPNSVYHTNVDNGIYGGLKGCLV